MPTLAGSYRALGNNQRKDLRVFLSALKGGSTSPLLTASPKGCNLWHLHLLQSRTQLFPVARKQPQQELMMSHGSSFVKAVT